METLTQNKGLRIKEPVIPRTELISTYQGKDLVFLHPAYGPDAYINVGNQIETDGLAKPNMAQTASLIYDAFNSDNKYSKEIRDIMENRRLWGFTGILYVPNKGAYVQDNPEVRNNRVFMEESELVKKLDSNDASVRFVPFGFNIKDMSSLELSKNSYVIALVGEEGADKLAEVADKHRRKPYLRSFKSVEQPITRVSALGSGWGGGGLGVDGGYLDGGNFGFAFGVRDTGEASRAQK